MDREKVEVVLALVNCTVLVAFIGWAVSEERGRKRRECLRTGDVVLQCQESCDLRVSCDKQAVVNVVREHSSFLQPEKSCFQHAISLVAGAGTE